MEEKENKELEKKKKKLARFKTIGNLFKSIAETEAYKIGFEYKERTKISIHRLANEKEISLENYC